MEFKKNELLNDILDKHFETWSHTLDTGDFVPTKYLKKVDKIIFKNLKKKIKECEIYNLLYLKDKGYKLGLFQKLSIWASGLKPLYLSEKQEKVKKVRKPKHKKRSKVVKDKAESGANK